MTRQEAQKALYDMSNISTGIIWLSEDGVQLEGDFTLDDLKRIVAVLEQIEQPHPERGSAEKGITGEQK